MEAENGKFCQKQQVPIRKVLSCFSN